MKISETTELTMGQKEAILALWNSEYPGEICYSEFADFENYLNNLTDKYHLLLTGEDEEILGWAFQFVREGKLWFAIILSEKIHGQRYGTKMLNVLKKRNTRLSGWTIDHNNSFKQNGNPYRSPLGFYLKNGFTVMQDVRLETEKISAVKIEWHS